MFMDWLRSQRPDLVPRYEQLYARGAYAPKAERERIGGVLRRRAPQAPAARDARGRVPPQRRLARRSTRPRRLQRAPAAVQQALF